MRVLGKQGMVASPHYLASGAGLNVLRRGGSAVDAAIATNAVLAVVAPYVCGIGGDLFAQVYTAKDGSLVGLNGSGRAPARATPERMRELTGGGPIPARGPLSVTVPGCVEAWGQLHERYGRLPLGDVLADAVRYAEDGFPVTQNFALAITRSEEVLHPDTPARETFFPEGKPPVEGQILTQPRLARTLRTIASEGPRAYYHGGIAQEIAGTLTRLGALMTPGDLEAHASNWVEPLNARYRDVTVFELPPNTQGVIALEMLAMLDTIPSARLASGGDEWVHLLAEVARLAYADRERYLTDPEHMAIDPARLFSQEYARERIAGVGHSAGHDVPAGSPGDTIYLCAADREGNLCSLIESNWMGIGSGVMAGDTGIMLQNRGHWFSLDAGHANVIAPNKRTLHTLIPGMAFRDGRPWLVFGSMGGSAQAQIHVELLTRRIDQDLHIDEAIDAPRFDAVVGQRDGRPLIWMESRFSPEVVEGLEQRGNIVELLEPYSSAVGHTHAIEVLPTGAYAGAADPRHNSLAIGY